MTVVEGSSPPDSFKQFGPREIWDAVGGFLEWSGRVGVDRALCK